MTYLVLRLVSILLLVDVVLTTTSCSMYCATIHSNSASGASGYVSLSISDGIAVYGSKLDLTHFETSCNVSDGLKYHVHSYWNNQTADSTANSFCGASITGGHYDPNFACSSSSQETTSCGELGRVSTAGYTYSCSSTLYDEGKYSSCEVGDISGKSGLLMPTSTNGKVFKLPPFVDYFPPYVANYNTTDSSLNPWLSIVFHCPANNDRLVCAKFSNSDLHSCAFDFMQGEHCGNHNTSGVAYSDYTAAIIASVVFCTIGFILLGWFIGKKYARTCSPTNNYEGLDPNGNLKL